MMMRMWFAMLWLMPLLAQAGDLPNLLVREGGARVAGFSSATGGADVDQLLPPREVLAQAGVNLNDFVWCTTDNAPFPHWVTFEFRQPQWLTTLVFNNELNDEMAYPGISARSVEVWVGEGARDDMKKVAAFELERNKNGQSVRIAPVQVQRLKFVITRNWGNDTWTEVSAFAAYDDGSRPAGFAEAMKKDGKVDVYGIYFDFASASLRPESKQALQEILAYHKAETAQKILIEGHTDNVGSDNANRELSLRRARAVIEALAKMGGDARRFKAEGYGAAQPVADNDSAAGRAKNRRVTVRIEK